MHFINNFDSLCKKTTNLYSNYTYFDSWSEFKYEFVWYLRLFKMFVAAGGFVTSSFGSVY